MYIDRSDQTAPKVFVKFTQELSALRVSVAYAGYCVVLANVDQAVNALEGRIFNGNTINALFYDSEAFEQGAYNN